MGEIQIEAKNVSFSYEEGNPVVEGLTFQIRQGESVGLIGANGSGKSTIFKMLAGLLPHQGNIKICGREVKKENFAFIRQKLGYVLQDADSQLFMPTVYDDIVFGPRNYGMSREEAEQCADQALKRTGISHLKHRSNYKMSGGEKRMACIAVILAMKPEIILMDEPSTALDPCNRRTLIRTLNELPETKLIASHDLDLVLETCERAILLGNQGILADGNAEEILSDEALLASCRLELPLCRQHIVPAAERKAGSL